jgi:hypothetical protein
MDWDIGPNGAMNIAAISPLDSTIAYARRLDPNFPLVGIKLISELPVYGTPTDPEVSTLNFYALDNDGSNGSASTYSGFDQNEKWETMITPRAMAGPRDISMIYGVKDLPLASKDSVNLTFVLAFAVDDAGLKAAIDKAEELWKGTAAVGKSPDASTSFNIFPNPTTDILRVNWDGSTKASISVVDVLGRKIVTNEATGTSAALDLSGISNGSYRFVLETEQGSFTKNIIKQ